MLDDYNRHHTRSLKLTLSSYILRSTKCMMTSLNRNIFRVTGHLCGEFTGDRWIPRTKASDSELWCFLRSAPWINGWVNNREAGDLRRHCTHYDVILMWTCSCWHAQLSYLWQLMGELRTACYYKLSNCRWFKTPMWRNCNVATRLTTPPN